MLNRFSAVTVALLLAGASPTTAPTGRARAQTPAADSSWVKTSGIYEIFVRDFSPTGDFRGVIRGLDRVQAVGANVIWLMPIYPVGVANRKGTLGSPYAGEFHRETGSARDIEQPIVATDAEPVMDGDVLAAVGRLAQRRKVDCPAAPALVDNLPGIRVGSVRHVSIHVTHLLFTFVDLV